MLSLSGTKGSREEFLIAGEFNYRPERRFLNLYFFPYFLALVSLFCCEVGANIYSLSIYLVVLLSQTSPGPASNAQFVYVEARVRVFPAGMGYSSVVTAFFLSFNAQPQFKCQHFFFNLNSR